MDDATYTRRLAEQGVAMAAKREARAQTEREAERARRRLDEQIARTAPSWVLPDGAVRRAAERREAAEARRRMTERRRTQVHSGRMLSNFALGPSRGRRAPRPRVVVAAEPPPPADPEPSPPTGGPVFDHLRAASWTWRDFDRGGFAPYVELTAWHMLSRAIEMGRA